MAYASSLLQRRRVLVLFLTIGFLALFNRGSWPQLSSFEVKVGEDGTNSSLGPRALSSSSLEALSTECADDPTLCAFAALLCDDELVG